MRRIFGRSSWKMHGRFYGGFWHQIGQGFRSQIHTIDSSTIEVDCKGLRLAIFSAQKEVVDKADGYELTNSSVKFHSRATK